MTDHTINLPNEMMQKIFLDVPIRELLGTEILCHHWRTGQYLAFQNVTSLTLYHSGFTYNQRDIFQLEFFEPLNFKRYEYGNNGLDEDCLSKKKAAYLANRLLQIVKLQVFDSIPNVKHLISLTNSWGNQLTSLVFSTTNLNFNWAAFWPKLREMNSLRHLTLIRLRGFVDLFILPRLETFSAEYAFTELRNNKKRKVIDLANLTNTSDLLVTFFHFSHNIRSICLHTFNGDTGSQGLAAAISNLTEEMRTVMRTQVTHLTLQTHRTLSRSFGFAAGQCFHALTHLDLEVARGDHFNVIISELMECKVLTNLRLSCKHEHSQFYNFYTAAPPFEIFQKAGKHLAIRKLHFSTKVSPEMTSNSATPNFYQNNLALAVPNLEELHFENDGIMVYCRDDDPLKQHSSCDSCMLALYKCFYNDFPQLSKVTRNGGLVFDRVQHQDTALLQQLFINRLKQIGLREYTNRFTESLDENVRLFASAST